MATPRKRPPEGAHRIVARVKSGTTGGSRPNPVEGEDAVEHVLRRRAASDTKQQEDQTMKLSEAPKCGKCGEGLLHTQLPFCFKIELTPIQLDQRAAQQTEGLTMMFGGALQLAEIMGPDPEVLKEDATMKTQTHVCFYCLTTIIDGVDELADWPAKAQANRDIGKD